MRSISKLLPLLVLCVPCAAEEVTFHSTPLKQSESYDQRIVRDLIRQRIRNGVYRDYKVDLGVDDPDRCNDPAFEPYKVIVDGQVTYTLRLKHGMWGDLPRPVRQAIIAEIEYFTWGHLRREYPPLDVWIQGDSQPTSPLSMLADKSREMFATYGQEAFLYGGKGRYAYGPNCWYNAISAVADKDCRYAKNAGLASGDWKWPRFMGPTEFRAHMRHFRRVEEPQFGDVVRYYTDEPVYEGWALFGGEVHAAVYIGEESYVDAEGTDQVRQIVLTKNGRSDLDFLIFQDLAQLDEYYASGIQTSDGEPVKREFFRAKAGAAILDPAVADEQADAHDAYLVDLRNYRKRWACLAGRIPPPIGGTAFSYPAEWEVPSYSRPGDSQTELGEAVSNAVVPAVTLDKSARPSG